MQIHVSMLANMYKYNTHVISMAVTTLVSCDGTTECTNQDALNGLVFVSK